MFPRTAEGEKRHRQRKREKEIKMILCCLRDETLRLDSAGKGDATQILEFGAGDGFQIPYLQQLGQVTALDICLSDSLKKMSGVTRVESSITETPFSDETFDLIFSNHVIEHIEQPDAAFRELRRIGKQDSLYAFSVPNALWLLLSIPAQYYNKVKTIARRMVLPAAGNGWGASAAGEKKRPRRNLLNFFGLRGHGVETDFLKCYRSFKQTHWEALFLRHGFRVLAARPLLLYGASEWPLVPTTAAFNRWSISSSILFLMQKGP